MKKMAKYILIGLSLFIFSSTYAQDYDKTRYGVKVDLDSIVLELQFYTPTTVRVLKYPKSKENNFTKKSFSVIKVPEDISLKIKGENNILELSSSKVKVLLNTGVGTVVFKTSDEEKLVEEKRNYSMLDNYYDSYKLYQSFELDKNEAIYGLGQHQHGKLNQRNTEMFLKQANTEIAIPIVHSVKGYALLWDNYSPTQFKDSQDGLSFTSDAGECIDYYLMYGGNSDGVIAQIRELTGQAPMFPLWTFGYWQSRERYTSQDELLGVVEKYRDLKVPLDGIVQDWQYWGTDNKNWNAVEFNNPLFPDPQKMIDNVHKLNAHIMISVWPSFGPLSTIHNDLQKRKMLLNFDTYPHNIGVRVYDVFNPEARNIYWDYMNRNLFSLGMDGWWLDATEPEDNIDDVAMNGVTYEGRYRNVANAFPLVSVGGVYDHQRATTSDKRVFILTRSAFIGQQRYGANSWSGDIDSRWDVLKKQISGGLNFSLSGIPYWNSDIGGFWADRVYPDGIKDKAFHELYVRWLQFATFTPMMRSHGTNTPREIFLFGERGNWAFDAIEKFIKLRYNLLPYIYSTSFDVTNHSGTMMRAMAMDFAHDENTHDIDDQFMFGKSLLVAPVTDSMYVDRIDGVVTENFRLIKSKKVYLPEGADWYDFWTGDKLKGGKVVEKQTPISVMPLYVKAGTIMPWGEDVQYAEEKRWDNLDLYIFSGDDGQFTLYEDENDNYNYEKGQFSSIKIEWCNATKILTIGECIGTFKNMLNQRYFNIALLTEGKHIGSFNDKKTISYTGKEIKIKLNDK